MYTRAWLEKRDSRINDAQQPQHSGSNKQKNVEKTRIKRYFYAVRRVCVWRRGLRLRINILMIC